MEGNPDQAATPRELRWFGLVAATLTALLFGLLPAWRLGGAPPAWPLAVAAALALSAILFPRALAPVHRAFTAAGRALGWVNTRVVLGLVYFLLLTPTALVMRLAGRDALRLRFDPSLRSYRVPSSRLPRERMEVPY